MRLKEKDGIHSTLSRIRSVESCTWPIWVKNTDSPLGSLTEMCATEVILVRRVIEWTMGSVAPLSMIQSLGVKSNGMVRLEEKTECSKDTEDCRQKGKSGCGISRIEVRSLPAELKGLDVEAGLEIWERTVAAWWVPRFLEEATEADCSMDMSWWHWDWVSAIVVSSSSFSIAELDEEAIAVIWTFPLAL